MDYSKLKTLFEKDLTHKEIAEILGCTRSTVSRHIKKLNLKKPPRIDIEDFRKEVEQGLSFSKYAKKIGVSLSTISEIAKKNNIKSKRTNHLKELPMPEVHKKYVSGTSVYSLAKEYEMSSQTIIKRLNAYDSSISIRSMDEAKRCNQLNDPDELKGLLKKYTMRKISQLLGVRPNTVSNAVKRLKLRQYAIYQKVDVDDNELIDLYVNQNMSIIPISEIYNCAPSTIARKLKSFGVAMKPAHGLLKPSKYDKLNDVEWLKDIYSKHSIQYIALIVGSSVSNVAHYLDKYKIPRRPKKESYRLLRVKQSKKDTVNTKWGKFKVHSKQERKFLESLCDDIKDVKREPITLEYKGFEYTPDFMVDGDIIEIKSKEYMQRESIDRQKNIKQLLIAKKNNVSIKYWYKNNYYDVEDIGDIDKYYCINWKILYDDPDEIFEYYADNFKPIKFSREQLYSSLKQFIPEDKRFDSSYSNSASLRILKHFNEHFWYSSFKNYNPISYAFNQGNSVILRDAINKTWSQSRNVNIYGLVTKIKRHYRDFAEPSLFKPWVAGGVYDELLPNGGIVYDPCIGWGGRMIGCIDRDIKYIGRDLNNKSVDGCSRMAEFVGSLLLHEPDIGVADARVSEIPKCDLIFTSPPYDDTEYYYGLNEQCKKTNDIYDNLMSGVHNLIALNVPQRHIDIVMEYAKKHGLMFKKEIKMYNKDLVLRNKTYEPILVFKK